MWRPRRTDQPAGTLRPGQLAAEGFEVIRLLSHGRRLDCYHAYDLARDAPVILKQLRPDRRHEPRVVDAVRLEGELATTLHHPHLVRGLDYLPDDGPAIVFQLLTGATLGALIEESMQAGGPLGVADVCHLGLQLVSALSYVHRHGWLHLDVKPNNVIVQAGAAVLIDFSLAGRPGRGRPGAGTRGYLAPEQARGEGLSTATDVWGLGVTLMECLSGDLPFGDEATWDTGHRLPLFSRSMPTRPQLVPEGLPADLETALLATLDLDASARPTLADLRSVFTSTLGGRQLAG